jgi:hypothetical protein
LFVWEILSVHSTPRKRDAALAALKRIRALTPDAMWRAAHAKLEASVALAGPCRAAVARSQTGVDLFTAAHRLDGASPGRCRPPPRVEAVPQLAAGAHRMLLFAADHPILPVDARVTGSACGSARRAGRRLREGVAGRAERADPRAAPAVDAFRRAFQYCRITAPPCTETDPHCTSVHCVGLSRGQEEGDARN